LSEESAALIAGWIISGKIEISTLILRENCIGDAGLKHISAAIQNQSGIFYLDLAQNGLTVRCAQDLYSMLKNNKTIVYLDLGSFVGGGPNRFGKEVSLSLGRIFEADACLIQHLNLNGVSLCNEDLQRIVDHLIRGQYSCLDYFDISNNRLEGIEGGKAVADLISRVPTKSGLDLKTLNVSQNKFGSKGA
jgi:hypothetical protein